MQEGEEARAGRVGLGQVSLRPSWPMRSYKKEE